MSNSQERIAVPSHAFPPKPLKTQEDIELDGFIRQTLVALTANMAAATIHTGKMLEWNKLVPQAMAGAKECWKAIKEERDARSKS